jgi:hypothetical protein
MIIRIILILLGLIIAGVSVGSLIATMQLYKRNELNSLGIDDPARTQISFSDMPLCKPQKQTDVAELTMKALDERMTICIKSINERIVNAAQKGNMTIKFTEPREQFRDYFEDYYSERGYDVYVTNESGTSFVTISWEDWIADAEIEQEVKTVEASDLDKYYDYNV